MGVDFDDILGFLPVILFLGITLVRLRLASLRKKRGKASAKENPPQWIRKYLERQAPNPAEAAAEIEEPEDYPEEEEESPWARLEAEAPPPIPQTQTPSADAKPSPQRLPAPRAPESREKPIIPGLSPWQQAAALAEIWRRPFEWRRPPGIRRP